MRYYKIVIGDSRNMYEVEDESIQLVMTSPPYFGITTYSKDNPRDLSLINDKRKFFRELHKVWRECYRVVRPNGFIVVNWQDLARGSRVYGYPHEICVAGDMVKSVESAGFVLIGRWIWWKYESGAAIRKARYSLYNNLENSIPRPLSNWEYCFAFLKRGFKKRNRKLDFSRKDWIEWSSGVWRIEAEKPKILTQVEDVTESAVYPVELPRRFIKIYSNEGDTVLDPFLGSGTTMLASFIENRNCIGYEVNKKFLPIIKKRVHYGIQTVYEKVKWEVIGC